MSTLFMLSEDCLEFFVSNSFFYVLLYNFIVKIELIDEDKTTNMHDALTFCEHYFYGCSCTESHIYSHAEGRTQLTLTFLGDEHLSYYLTSDGVAMKRGADGDFYVITDFADRKTKASARRAVANEERIKRLHRKTTLVRDGQKKAFGGFNTITGSKKGLVILVNFSDVAFQKSSTKAVFDDMFNKVGYSEDGHIGSVHDYFKDQSYEQFDLTFDVVGPVTLSNNMAYYGGNNSSGNDLRPREMVKEACELVNSSVNFANYDWDNDGYVDQVFIIYAGYCESNGADSNTIWPHEWQLSSALPLDGVNVKTYACTCELSGTSGTSLNGMGTAVHEFSHCLGYPDTYDIDYSGGVGMDYYDVMSAGNYNGPQRKGEVPIGYSAYQRWCAGWLNPTELTEAVTVTNMPALNDKAVAYIIKNSSNANEYFLLENRQAKQWFGYFRNKSGVGHGLFVMHVDYDATIWSDNTPNDVPTHQRICWVPADGSYGTYDANKKSWSITKFEDHLGDFFPGTGNVTTFDHSSHTTVGGKWNSGSSTFFYSVSNIAESADGKIGFSFSSAYPDGYCGQATIQVSPAGYSTYYNSVDKFIMPQGMSGYTAYWDETNGYTFMQAYTEGQIVPAGEPLVLKAAAGNYDLLYSAGTAEASMAAAGKNFLRGTDTTEETTAPSTDEYYFYGLSLDKTGELSSVGFYWMAENGAPFTNKAHKAYLAIPKSKFVGGAPQMSFVFDDDDATGLQSVSVAKANRVQATSKYFDNGKLVIVKNGKKYNSHGQRAN